ncbi:hypothetical protein QTP88_022497 [Uroleucon formosanum]
MSAVTATSSTSTSTSIVHTSALALASVAAAFAVGRKRLSRVALVGADTATLGLSFLLGRHSFSHPERMPPPRGFSERRFPRQSFSKGGHRVDKTLVQGFRRKTLRAPNFGRLPSRELATFGVWTLPSQRYSVVRQKWKSFEKKNRRIKANEAHLSKRYSQIGNMIKDRRYTTAVVQRWRALRDGYGEEKSLGQSTSLVTTGS